jgi:hypothetical protein
MTDDTSRRPGSLKKALTLGLLASAGGLLAGGGQVEAKCATPGSSFATSGHVEKNKKGHYKPPKRITITNISAADAEAIAKALPRAAVQHDGKSLTIEIAVGPFDVLSAIAVIVMFRKRSVSKERLRVKYRDKEQEIEIDMKRANFAPDNVILDAYNKIIPDAPLSRGESSPEVDDELMPSCFSDSL